MTVEKLRRKFPGMPVFANRSYRELTSFGIGSAPVPVLAEPDNVTALAKLVKYLNRTSVKTFILGAGTNIVGSDTPYDGVMIRLAGESFTKIEQDGNLIKCGAFAKLPLVAQFAAKAGLRGFAPLSGIPGSIGGALRMNAGASGTEISSLVKEISGVRSDGSLWHAAGSEIEWFYRATTIPKDVIITEAVFQLESGDRAQEEAAIAAELENRKKREPAGRSAGCAFRNVSAFEPAGKLIDQCGLRGFKLGDLLVSDKHANYLINTGSATEKDYIRLVRILRRAVSEKHGFYLLNEIVPVNPQTALDIELDTPAPRVNVLYGGTSSEREISLQSGSNVAAALRHAGFKVELTDIRHCAVTPLMRECDVVYPVLHGGFGENGQLQAELEKEELRFVGSASRSSYLVMDKIATKELLDAIHLPTAPWAKITRSNREFPSHLHFPVMLKAPCEGSTVGILKVNSITEWQDAVEAEFKYADELLVEEFVKGVEITVPVLNADALGAIEIVSPGGFYDWDAKYEYKNGQTEYFCPPRSLDEETVNKARELALKFYHAARCRDILRVDFIVDAAGTPYILEGNSLPGNTAHSLVPMAAREAGISMENMVTRMVYAAMKRSGEPESSAGENNGAKCSKVLIRCCRWMLRLTVLLCAGLLLYAGIAAASKGLPGWPLIAGAVFMLVYEFVLVWLKSLEKK